MWQSEFLIVSRFIAGVLGSPNVLKAMF